MSYLGLGLDPVAPKHLLSASLPLPWERNFMFSAVFVLEDSKTHVWIIRLAV